MTLARTPYARLSPADIGQVDRELKKLEQMSAGLYVPKVLVAARSPYTVQGTDTMLLCDCTAGPVTLTFPLAARVEGMTVVVVKSDTSANAVTLSGTFSGVVNPTLTVAHAGFTVFAMNGAYHVTALVHYPILPGETGVTAMVYPYGHAWRYGAKGDGGVTANLTPLNNAIASASAAGFGTVFLPRAASTYNIAGTITMLSNINLVLEFGAELKQTTQYTPCIQANAQSGFTIVDARTYGVGNWSSGWVDDSHLDIGIYITNCTDFRIVRPRTYNHALAGVWIDTCSDYTVEGPARYEGTNALGVPLPPIAFHQYGLVLARSGVTSARATLIGQHRALNSAFGYSIGDIDGVDFGSACMVTDTYIAQHAFYMGASNVTLGAVKLSAFRDIGLKIFYGTVGTQKNITGTSTIEIETDADNTEGIVIAADVGGTLQGVKLAATIRNTNATPATHGLAVGVIIENAAGVEVDVAVKSPVQKAVSLDVAGNSDIDITVDCPDTNGYGVSISAAYTNVRVRGSIKATAAAQAGGFSGVFVAAVGDGLRIEDLVTDTFWWPVLLTAAATKTAVRNCRHINFSTGSNEPASSVTDDVVWEDNDDGFQITNLTSAITASVFHRALKADGTVAAFNVTLPDATKSLGRKLSLIKTDSTAHAVGFAGAGGQTVNGVATFTTATQWTVLRVISDGLNWMSV